MGNFSPLKGKWELGEEEPPSLDLEEDASPTSFAPKTWFGEECLSGTPTVLKDRQGRVLPSWVTPALLGPRKDQEDIVFLQL